MADAKVRVRAVDETQAAFRSVEKGLNGLKTSAASVTRSLGAIGAVLGVGAFGSFAKDAINAADSLGKASQKIGITVQSLSAFTFAAQQSGSSSEEFEKALIKLNVSLTDAQTGGKETAQVFKDLKLDPASFRNTEEALLAIAERFSQLENSSTKTEAAIKLFGRAGANLIPLLNSGRQGLEAFRAEAEKLGLIISPEQAKAAADFNDALDKLTRVFKALVVSAAPFLEIVTKTINELIRGTKEAGGFVNAIQTLGTINPFKSVEQNIKEISDELARLEKDKTLITIETDGLVDADQRIQRLRTQLTFLQRQQREAITGNLAAESPPVPPRRQQLQRTDETASKAAADAIKKANDAAIKEQERQRGLRAQNAVEYSQYLVDLEVERIRETTKAEEQAAKDLRDLQAQNAVEYSQYRLDIELKRIADITAAEKKAIEDRDKEAKDSLQKQKDLVRDLGLVFTSATEDALVNLKSAKDVLDGIVKDFTRLAVRKGITEPFLTKVTGAVGEGGSFDFKKIFGALGGFLGFKHGGVVRGLQPFAAGGIVNTPTPALIGEGRTAEAIVPLPDGKAIPAKITGMQPAQVSVNVYGVTDTRDFLRASDQIAFATQRALSKAAQRR
jgi:hypothetical protein